MTTSTKLHIAGYSLLLFAIVAIASFWMQEKIAGAKAQAAAEARKEAEAELDAKIKARDADAAKQKQDVDRQLAAATSSSLSDKDRADKMAALLAEIAGLKQPITVQVPAQTAEQKAAGKPPDAPSAVLTQEQLTTLTEGAATCKKCLIDKSQLEQDKADLQTKFTSADQRAKDWEKAAKGGSKWKRFAKALKVVGCAGGGALVGSLGKQPQAGAAIGAAAGAGLCSIF